MSQRLLKGNKIITMQLYEKEKGVKFQLLSYALGKSVITTEIYFTHPDLLLV